MQPAMVNNWTCGAAHTQTTDPSATLGLHPLTHKLLYYSFPILLRVEDYVSTTMTTTNIITTTEGGLFACVRWQVTLCDPIWQVTSCSCEMEFH